MAILSRVKISPQQRYDLEDFFAEQSAARTDAKLWAQKFLSESNLILGGFSVSGIGLTQATVAMMGAAFIFPQNTSDFSYYVASPAEPDVVIPDSSLVDGARNYVEIQLTTQDGTPLTKAFWDPEANSGAGAEFNQIVNMTTDLKCSFVVSTGGFSGSPDRLPVAIIDCDGAGVIKVILDRRELFGRLSKPNDLDNGYAWGTKVEPVYNLTMNGVVGTFQANEEISIGGETATVVTGGTGSITFNCPTGINFENGDTVTGLTSGATGTVNTIAESFTGVDKSLKGQKNINDAIMSEIRDLKGTRFWWQVAPSTGGVKNEVQSAIAPITSGAKVKWTGTNLIITDDDLTPATTDDIAAIRVFTSSKNLYLRRQDDGKEVVTISLSDIPTAGTLTLDQDGNSIAIPRTFSNAQVQAAWDASGAYAATIFGAPSEGKIVIVANAAGLQVDVTETSNTYTKGGLPVSVTYAIKQGLASDSSIAIADGQVLYVDLPSPLADQNYSGLGSGAGNYKVAARGSLALNDTSYWLAYREGSKLIWRGIGEVQAGEVAQISDTIPQGLLDAIGIASEASMPSYTSNIRGSTGESLVSRAGALTDSMGDAQEDRSAYLRSDAEVSWTGSQLDFTSDIVLEIINTKNGTLTQHSVLVASSPITLNDGESAWVEIDRDATSENLTVFRTSINAIPAQTQDNKDVFVLFRRKDANGSGYLHVPLHKQVIEPGQTVRLGASGSGSGDGSGIGDDLGSLLYSASFSDDLSDGPTAPSLTSIDTSAGKTDATLYSASSKYYRLAYDATQTVTGTGTSMTLSGTPSFVVKNGDILRVGTEARRITNVISQISYTIEAAFTTDPSAAAACVSQAVYTKDLNNFAADGVAVSTSYTGSIASALVRYNDTVTSGDTLYNYTDPSKIAFTASSDGSAFTNVQSRQPNLSVQASATELPTAGTNLYLRFFASLTSGSGFVNLVGYKAFFHKDEATEGGGYLQQAICFTNSVGTPVGCSQPTVVGGKTQLILNFPYTVGISPGSPNGQLTVVLNGQKIPRFIDSTLTPDASYVEVNANTIQLDKDYSSFNLSLEVFIQTAVVDSASQNTTDIAVMKAHGFNNMLVNSAFDIWQRGTSTTVANGVSTYLADRWYAKNSLGTDGVLTYSRVAGSVSGSKYGASVQITTAPTALHANGCELYQTLENFDSLKALNQFLSSSFNVKALGNVTQVGVQFFYATTEAKVTTALGTEQLVSVNSSSFTFGTLVGQSVGVLPTSSGVVGIRIRIAGVSSGNLYDLNNGFVVEQVMMNLGGDVAPYARAGKNFQEEVALCQRFYEKSYELDTQPGVSTLIGGLAYFARPDGNVIGPTVKFSVRKRIIPTVVNRDNSGGASANTPAQVGSGSFALTGTGGAANASYIDQWTADAEI